MSDRRALPKVQFSRAVGMSGSLTEIWTIRREDKIERLEFIMISTGNLRLVVNIRKYRTNAISAHASERLL